MSRFKVQQARCWQILEALIRENRPMRTGEFVTLLGTKHKSVVSECLNQMKELGLVTWLENEHGEVEHGWWDRVLLFPSNMNYREKLTDNPREKNAIAQYIVRELIQDAVTVGLDAGTSVTAVFRQLGDVEMKQRPAVSQKRKKALNRAAVRQGTKARKELRRRNHIFTSNIDGALRLLQANYPADITLQGGLVSSSYATAADREFTGDADVSLDVAVVGVTGISENGLATHDESQHPYKLHLCTAERVIIPATNGKLSKQGGTVFYDKKLSQRFRVVVDNNLPRLEKEHLDRLRREIDRLGDRLVLVNKDGHEAHCLEPWPD